MARRMLLADLALIALLAWIAWRFIELRDAARAREARTFGESVAAKTYPPLEPLPAVQAVTAVSYADVALRTLFSKDRNPNVIIDPEPVAPKPVMPPLPSVQGVMTIGEPGIIMTERGGAGQRTYRAGEKIGPFKLVAFDSEQVTFDWNGERVVRKMDDLLEKGPPAAAVSASTPGAAAPVVAEQAPVQMEERGPGGAIGGGYRGCLANDSSPAGTVRDGVRKVENIGPMGRSCRWEPVK